MRDPTIPHQISSSRQNKLLLMLLCTYTILLNICTYQVKLEWGAYYENAKVVSLLANRRTYQEHLFCIDLELLVHICAHRL